MTGRPSTAPWVLMTLALVAAGLVAEWAHAPDGMSLAGVVDLATGWAIGACGLVAWTRAPRSLVGPLLVAAAFAWFLGTLRDPGTETGRLALSLLYLYAGIAVHAVFTWPTGRPTRSLDLVLVIGGYIVALASPLWQRETGVLVIGALLAVALLVQHSTLTPMTRRARRPAFVLGLVLVGALLGKRLVAQQLQKAGVPAAGDADTLWSLALVSVSAGLTWSLLVLQRRHSRVTELVVRLGERDAAGALAAMARVSAGDPAVMAAMARAARMIARNEALHAELEAQVRDLEASRRRLLEVGDEERSDLEERLREGTLSRLAALGESIAALAVAGGSDASGAEPRLRRAAEQLAQASGELEGIAQGLDPVSVREGGLKAALQDLAVRSPVPVEVDVTGDLRATVTVQATLYFVASEAIANVIRHAHAAHAWLWISGAQGELTLEVEDDGVGGADPLRGSGLRGLQDRLDALGGSLQVAARGAGGTRLSARVSAGERGAGPV